MIDAWMLLAQDETTTETGLVDLNPVDITMAAFVLPPLISLINQRRWVQEIKALVALGVCVAYAAIVTLIRGEVDWQDWRNSTLQVCAATFAAYKLFWNPSNLAPHLETLTTHPPVSEADRNLPAATLDKAGLPPATVEREGEERLAPAGPAREAANAEITEDVYPEADATGGATDEPPARPERPT